MCRGDKALPVIFLWTLESIKRESPNRPLSFVLSVSGVVTLLCTPLFVHPDCEYWAPPMMYHECYPNRLQNLKLQPERHWLCSVLITETRRADSHVLPFLVLCVSIRRMSLLRMVAPCATSLTSSRCKPTTGAALATGVIRMNKAVTLGFHAARARGA